MFLCEAREQDRIRQEAAALLKAATPIQPALGVVSTESTPARDAALPSEEAVPSSVDPSRLWQSLYGSSPPQSRIHDSESPASAEDRAGSSEAQVLDAQGERMLPRAIQMHNLYLVAETEDGIIIVDQHALHERIMYEQLRRRMTAGPLESQRLLLPETLTITPRQAVLLETHADLLHRLGIEVTPFGTDAVAVQSFPALLKDTDVLSFMKDLLDKLAEQSASTGPDVPLNDLLSMMACKAAVKAGDSLTREEIDALMQQRYLVDKSSSCPHGRPTTLRFTKDDLNRQFHRT